LLHRSFDESNIFRMDHFLGKQTVQNLLGLRFANHVFEPIWDADHVARVEIIWDETLTVGSRTGYYDSAGALHDMVQNHLLQLLCHIAMDPPMSANERDLRQRKVEVLRSVRTPAREEVGRLTVRARYGSGHIEGRDLRAYVEEPGVDPARNTETFAQVKLTMESWRWAGVPFVLRAGKALGRSRKEIAVHFKRVPHFIFAQPADPPHNVLRILLDPDRMALSVNLNSPRAPSCLTTIELDADLALQELPPYALLLIDVLTGDPTLSIRADEVEESWRIIDPIVEAWRTGTPPLLEYPAGSSGPPIEAN
jgi:glucose-6-phosphate 1-dehydrogenase